MVAAFAFIATPSQQIARAQSDSTLVMTADAGFGAYIKDDVWVPIRVTIVNAGAAIEGDLVLVNSRNQTPERYLQRISIGSGATRRASLFIPGNSNSYEIKLMQGDAVLARTTPLIRLLSNEDRLVVAVSDPPDAFNFLGDARVPLGGSTSVAQMTLSELPDRSGAYDAADVILFNAVDTSSLSQSQIDALQAWVVAGGHLVLSGGPGGPLARGGFNAIAPSQIGQSIETGSIADIATLIKPSNIESVASVPTQTAPLMALTQPRPNARVLAASSTSPLIIRQTLGMGVVDQFAFDPSLAPLSDWPGRAAFFEVLFGGRTDRLAAIGGFSAKESAQQSVSALVAPPLPSPLIAFLFASMYVLFIGPINFYVLRRLKRTSLAWLTIPALVLVFTGVGLLTGFNCVVHGRRYTAYPSNTAIRPQLPRAFLA